MDTTPTDAPPPITREAALAAIRSGVRPLPDLTGAILDGAYVCSRVWEAWWYGTMTESDFTAAGDDEDLCASLLEWRDDATAIYQEAIEQAIADLSALRERGDCPGVVDQVITGLRAVAR